MAGSLGRRAVRKGPAQELRPQRSRRERTARRTVELGQAKTVPGRVARDTVSDGACGV
jgi:hypothetical protein